MKFIIKYKSRLSGKMRTEIFNTLNDLIGTLLKANELTDDREGIVIQTHKSGSIVMDAIMLKTNKSL